MCTLLSHLSLIDAWIHTQDSTAYEENQHSDNYVQLFEFQKEKLDIF